MISKYMLTFTLNQELHKLLLINQVHFKPAWKKCLNLLIREFEPKHKN